MKLGFLLPTKGSATASLPCRLAGGIHRCRARTPRRHLSRQFVGPMPPIFLGFSLLISALVSLTAQPVPPKAAPATAVYEMRTAHPNGIGKFYQGREIAHVMGHQAADWLERPEREEEERTSKLIEALKFKPGEKVADIGAGTGYHTRRISGKVGTNGLVYAVDIQPEMLTLLTNKLAEEKIKNVRAVLGTEKDPKLPPGEVDTILLVDVYHELEFPFEMTEAMCRALKPGGRLVLVEFRGEDPKVPIKEHHKMTEAQVKKEMTSHPVKWKETIGVLPWQHVIVFEKR